MHATRVQLVAMGLYKVLFRVWKGAEGGFSAPWLLVG